MRERARWWLPRAAKLSSRASQGEISRLAEPRVDTFLLFHNPADLLDRFVQCALKM